MNTTTTGIDIHTSAVNESVTQNAEPKCNIFPSIVTCSARNYINSLYSKGCASITITLNPLLQYLVDQNGSNINVPNLEIKATGKLTVKSGGKIFVQDQLQMDQNAAGAIVVE